MEHQLTSFRESMNVSNEEFIEMGRVGSMFFEQGNLHKARTMFEGLVEMDPKSAAARSALGAILALNHQDQDAIIHLEQAIHLDRKQIAPYVNLGEVLIRQTRLKEAVQCLRAAINLDPEQSDPAANRARALILGIYRVIRLDDRALFTQRQK